LTGVWTDASHSIILVKAVFPTDLHANYGAPAEVWLNITASAADAGVDLTVTFLNKTSTRYPEAMYCTFNPAGNTRAAPGAWTMDKLGTAIDVLSDVALGAGRGLHAVTQGVTFHSADGMALGGFGGRGEVGRGLRLWACTKAVYCTARHLTIRLPPTAGHDVELNTLDAAIVRWGTLYPFPTPLLTQPDVTTGANFFV